MDPVLDRVRAANPVSEDEFAGLHDFTALNLQPPKRRRKRFLAVPALGAIIAALVVLPNSAPQASEVLERAISAVEVDDGGILYARSDWQYGDTGGSVAGSGTREVWVRGETAMRAVDNDGVQEVYAEGEGTTRRTPGEKDRTEADMRMVPNEVFRARGLLERAKGVGLEETDDAFILRWREKSGPPHWPTIEMTMWIDKETYAPIRFTDHSFGKDAAGKPFDQTYAEEIEEFKTLPDTPENRQLLRLK